MTGGWMEAASGGHSQDTAPSIVLYYAIDVHLLIMSFDGLKASLQSHEKNKNITRRTSTNHMANYFPKNEVGRDIPLSDGIPSLTPLLLDQ